VRGQGDLRELGSVHRGEVDDLSQGNQHDVARHAIEHGSGPRPRHTTGQPLTTPVTQDQQVVGVRVTEQASESPLVQTRRQGTDFSAASSSPTTAFD
jgi:hypothetical protein